MLNKLYVIGNKQKEIVERCFIHNRGTYISPMADGDLFALTATQPVHKSHKNIEIFGLTKISMDHVKQEEEITEDEQHEKEQKLLEYKHIQDIHYFLPSFIVSQMLSSIIQFWIIWIMSTIGYFSLIFWVANKIVVIPAHEEDGVSTNAKMRTFATEKDLTEGVDNLWNAVMQTLFMFLVPFSFTFVPCVKVDAT